MMDFEYPEELRRFVNHTVTVVVGDPENDSAKHITWASKEKDAEKYVTGILSLTYDDLYFVRVREPLESKGLIYKISPSDWIYSGSMTQLNLSGALDELIGIVGVSEITGSRT